MERQGPNSTGNGSTTGASQTGSADRQSDLMNEARQAARDRALSEAENQRHMASRAVGDGAKALERAAESLDEQGQRTLAQTTTSLASGLSGFAQKLEHSNADELMQEARRLARENPALFILGGVGVGLALSRFLKASSDATDGRY